VTRVGTQWTLDYSPNGTAWTPAGTFSHTIAVNSVGVFAGNYGSGGSAPAHTALFDYFFDTAAPVSPEDGALAGGRTLTVNVSGSGSVLRSPDQSVYYCNETVTLTAQPSVGLDLLGLERGGDRSTNPTTVAMTANRSVTPRSSTRASRPRRSATCRSLPGDTFATVTWDTSEPATSRVDWRGNLDPTQVLNYGFERRRAPSSRTQPATIATAFCRTARRARPAATSAERGRSRAPAQRQPGKPRPDRRAVTFALWFKADDFDVFDARL